MKSEKVENETFIVMQEYFGAKIAATHIKQFPPEPSGVVVKSSRMAKRKFAAEKNEA